MKLSIIIPVYNAEKYIDRCIQSILINQFKDYEIILIDDGSTDRSLNIIQKYANEYIHVFSNKNHGVGYTRNYGLNKAKGEYIIFIDSDDYIDQDYLSTLLDSIDGYNVCISGVRFVDTKYKSLGTRKAVNSNWGKYQLPLTAGKIFKKSYILENNILYPEYAIGEDLVFNLLSYCYTKEIKIIDYIGYNYVQNPTSSTHSLNQKTVTNENQELGLIKFLDKKIPPNKIEDKFLSFFYLKTLIHHSLIKRKAMTYSQFKTQINEGINWIVKRFNKVNYFMFGEQFFVNIIVSSVFLFRKTILLKVFYKL